MNNDLLLMVAILAASYFISIPLKKRKAKTKELKELKELKRQRALENQN